MAQSSGQLVKSVPRESFERAKFADPASGAQYEVTPRADGYQMQFSRTAADVSGQRLLEWFVGSNRAGRSYLFSKNGFLFQAPVSYYARGEQWMLSPGYGRKPTIDLTRGVEASCLQCHSSRLQPIAGTSNGFQSPPFLEGGVSCERCHGPGQLHIERVSSKAAKGGRAIVNPAKLEAERRDSVCAQCHLTGAARVARSGMTRESYKPGDLLSASLAVFVGIDAGSEVEATSHFERLARSACKSASGDRLWCGSCHDPHQQPAAAEAANWYRERCQTCHAKAGCTESLAVRQKINDNCVQCHMPSGSSRSLDHVAFTDHSIPRRPQALKTSGKLTDLRSFWKDSNQRDEALAYSVVAMTEPGVRARAFQALRAVAAANPKDVAVLAQLAQFHDRMGAEEKAMELCETIVGIDPSHTAAAVNLGTYYVKRGRTREAIDLWQGALARNPGLSTARVNLAVAQFREGLAEEAKASLQQALAFDPDLEVARKMLAQLQNGR